MLNIRLRSAVEQGRRFFWGSVGVSIILAALGIAEWIHPSARPYGGKWAALKEILFSIFGSTGLALWWFALSLFTLLVARWAWRHTPKQPVETLL